MSWKSAGKTVIKLPLRVERRATKRIEAQKLKALQESGTAYPKGNRDLPPVPRPAEHHSADRVFRGDREVLLGF